MLSRSLLLLTISTAFLTGDLIAQTAAVPPPVKAATPKKELPMTPGGQYRAHDLSRPRPVVIAPPVASVKDSPGTAPSDAISLFNGKDLSQWLRIPRKGDANPEDKNPKWKVTQGYAEIVPNSGAIYTKEKFQGDGQLHIEWATPEVVSGNGQGRGNSGVFIEGFPEIQVLDSYNNDTYPDGQAAGLYSNYPPMVNASRKPGEWQSYDILFERAKLDAKGQVISKARLTVLHNGVVVHYQREFDTTAQEGDITLQDHLNPVRYRNIWLRPLRVDPDAVGTKPPTPKPPPLTIAIKTLTAQMKFSETEFVVRPGQQVKVAFENVDDLPHNIVFCQPGTDVVAMANKQMEKPDEALKRNWLPDDEKIWQHSRLLNPHEKETITFTAPEKPGDYPYVCTFPGHAMTMQGKMKVMPLGEGLKDLRFQLYLGKWDKLPDFSKLTPHRSGPVEDNLIQIKLDDYKNEFGVVFTGKINAPRKGSYRFYTTGDDGVRLLVDGKKVVEYDGIHPAGDIKEGSCQLDEGEHELRLEYFQGGGEIFVFAAWKGTNFDITPLSTWTPKGWEKGAKSTRVREFDPINLTVRDEAVIYRNFITGAGNRGIAVGYPGSANITWSAEQMNLALIWRGAFIDASKHWNSRGGGTQNPLGYDVVHPSDGEPFAILPTPDAAWPAKQDRAPRYTWKGYRLDDKRFPTFSYDWNGVGVEDRFDVRPSLKANQSELVRTLRLRSWNVPKGTYLRLLSGDIKSTKEGEYTINKLVTFTCDPALHPILRGEGNQRELLISIPEGAGDTSYTFGYAWQP